MKLVIGLVGEKGSGKQTFVNFLRQVVSSIVIPSEQSEPRDLVTSTLSEKDSSTPLRSGRNDIIIRQVRFSDILGQTLLLWDIPNTRENLQKLSIAMKNTFGQEALSRAAEFNIKNETADIIVLDGARRESEIAIVRKQAPNLLVYITADQNLRYERLKNRSEKVGETGLSRKQFMQEEAVETETKIPELGAKADIKIENNGSLEEFRQKVEKLCEKYIFSIK